MSMPIVFIHKGYSDYMEYSLRQAKYSNPKSEIILLGDESNNRFSFITHVNMKDYFSSAADFSNIYKHYSTNPYHYELFCIQRWFVLKEYMERNNMEECFVCDTDVMIYSNIKTSLISLPENVIAVLNIGNIYSFGIAFLYFETIEFFCNYILSCYNDNGKLEQFEKYYLAVIAKKNLGGVSDMFLVTNYLQWTNFNNVMNLVEVKNNTTFDSHIGLDYQEKDDHYKFRWNHKTITWQNKLPYCYSYTYQKNIRFHLLHFQGSAKYLIAKFYTGVSFPGKLYLDIKFFFANIVAFWYTTLKIRYRFAWLFAIIFKEK